VLRAQGFVSFRTSFLGLADGLRKLQGATGFDVATSQLTIRKRLWAGGAAGTPGGYTDTDLALPQHYKIRTVTAREVAGSGGVLLEGDIKVGPITPSDGAGVGYTPAQLRARATSPGEEIIYVVTGALAGDYTCVDANFSRAFGYMLTLRNMART
jgi:hypothetical protein